MSEPPPPGLATDTSSPAAPALTDEAVSAVLADFRDWLLASGACQRPGEPEGTASAPGEPIDLHTLLGQFLAVRQEVNLQTRAVRAQQEQNAEALRQLTAALDALRQAQARGDEPRRQDAEETIRPLLKTLIDLHDALSLAGREAERLRQTVQADLDQLTAEAPPAAPRPWWARPFGSPAADEAARERQRRLRAGGERVRQLLASLLTGYTMSLERLERALRTHGLEAIPAAGRRFDPERMEAVEAVGDSGRPAGEVIDEVRRGYLYNGRVFRYAQVRVAKS